jgi:hypothetical protein
MGREGVSKVPFDEIKITDLSSINKIEEPKVQSRKNFKISTPQKDC